MKKDILRLRKEGYTYNQIVEELGCSKGTISYHCGSGQKEKTLNRQRKNRDKVIYKIYGKIKQFKTKKHPSTKDYGKFKISDNIITSIIERPICYLTGRKINLGDKSSYSLDHIVPRCKGGSNEINNMGLCIKDVNMAKNGMHLNEFISMCVDVCINSGYIVTRE